MKTFLRNIIAALAVLAILYSSCKNPAKDVGINISTNIFKSPVLVRFMNAKPGGNAPQNMEINIIGPGAALVRSSTGAKVFKTANGYLNLVLDRAAAPSEANPVKFTVIAHATGFAPTYQDVVLTNDTLPTIYHVQMNEYANPAAATGAVVATQALTNGSAGSEIKFTTATNAGMSEKAVITIPAGTVFLDAAGQPTGGAQLEARVVHTGIDADGGVAALPGNGYAANVIGSNGQPISGGVYFDPVASVSINMLAGTKEVKSFSKPLTVDVELNPAKINPTTKQAIKEGETIPMWSLNNETGQWKQEGNATVLKNANGKLVGRMQITHLSDHDLAYEVSPCKVTITINRPFDGYEESFISYVGGDFYTNVVFGIGEKSKTVEFKGSDSYTRVRVQTNSSIYLSDDLIQTSDNICGKSFTFTFEAKPNLVNLIVSALFICSNENTTTGINGFITLTPVNTNDTPIGDPQELYMKYGLLKGKILNGQRYKIEAYVDDKTYTSYFTVDKTNMSLPSDHGISGTVTYDDDKNILRVKAEVKKSCN